MGTTNFKRMRYGMPMVCGYLNYDAMKEEYEREFDEEYTGWMYYDDQENLLFEAQEMAENFSDSLKYHTVSVVPGYYDGFQFWVEEKSDGYFNFDSESDLCIDNEDARYYFGLCRSKVLRAAEAEKRRISKWLESLDGNGFEIIVCVGIFNDGTAVYKKRDNKELDAFKEKLAYSSPVAQFV